MKVIAYAIDRVRAQTILDHCDGLDRAKYKLIGTAMGYLAVHMAVAAFRHLR